MVFKIESSWLSLRISSFDCSASSFIQASFRETSFHQDHSVEIFLHLMGTNHFNGKSMISRRLKDVNTTGLHGRSGLVSMAAETGRVAFLTEATGARTHAPGLVITFQKHLNLEADDRFAEPFFPLPRPQPSMEKDGLLIAIADLPGCLTRGC